MDRPPPRTARATARARIERGNATARRFAENLQSTPVAVSAFTNSVMRQFAIADATDLSGRAPNVQIMQTGAGSGAVSIFIRGTGNTALGFNLENPVGMYVDDVYLPRLQGSLIDALEFDRIEILRGPQGTLYGRDSTVGAVKYISKQPDLYNPSYSGKSPSATSTGATSGRAPPCRCLVQLAVRVDAADAQPSRLHGRSRTPVRRARRRVWQRHRSPERTRADALGLLTSTGS